MNLAALPNPKGILSSSPGLARRRDYPGSRSRDGHNPSGVASFAARPSVATPLGLRAMLHRIPRVARASQPWALGRNPVGIRISAAILDEINTMLAGHYGFTPEELDFILNYDIKYRLGRNAAEEED